MPATTRPRPSLLNGIARLLLCLPFAPVLLLVTEHSEG
jgi:hypothetical protein